MLKRWKLKILFSEQEWKRITDETYKRWYFPNAFVLAGGKQIALFQPKESASEFNNYKGFYSVALLALVNYNYKFMYIDVVCPWSISDRGVYNNSRLQKEAIWNNEFYLPPPKPLASIDENDILWNENLTTTSFLFVVDDAFPLSENIIKPHPQRNLDDKKRIF